ncbi:hypothetical protein PseudUWO310_03285 [Pseudanabaena sp. UWO310]|nr:hypothetical protein PseudUWO310_03285 [Pseudanabaena sp. UWO310]
MYSCRQLYQDIKPQRELPRGARQLSLGFDFCPKFLGSSCCAKHYIATVIKPQELSGGAKRRHSILGVYVLIHLATAINRKNARTLLMFGERELSISK